jgi:urease accessory protein
MRKLESDVNKRIWVLGSLLLGMTLWSDLASAHVEDEGASFVGGLLHPIHGPDHLLAMLSVGIGSVLMGGRAIWGLPALFVSAMVLGGAAGFNGMHFPFVELGIAFSVLILGAVVALGKGFPMAATAGIVALFGCFHGNAHGIEMPDDNLPIFFSLGFVVASAAIHFAGVGLGFSPLFRREGQRTAVWMGTAISLSGLAFVVLALR